LSVVLLDAGGQAIQGTVAWSSSDANVATVDNGLVTAVAPGNATVTASADGKSASTSVVVEDGGLIAPSGSIINSVGGVVQLAVPAAAVVSTSRLLIHQATQFPANSRLVRATAFELKVTPSNSGFSQPATLTIRYDPADLGGKSESRLRIFELSGSEWREADKSSVNTTTHTVSAPVTELGVYGIFVEASVASVVVSPDNLVLSVGQSSKLSASPRDNTGVELADRSVSWASSDASVARVDAATGAVTGVAPGSVTINATSEGVTGGTTVRVTAGPASRIQLNDGNGQTAAAGAAVQTAPSVIVTDAGGFVVSGVQVTFAVVAGGGSVSGAVVSTDTNGIARVGAWTLGNAAGLNTLSATAPGLDGSPVIFTATVPKTIGPPASISIFQGDGQTAAPGAAVPIAPAVKVLDAVNNPVPGVSVTFSIRSGNGSLTGAVAVTDANGIATVGSWILGSLGGNSLFATLQGVSGSPVIFVATAQTNNPPPPPPPPPPGPSGTPTTIAIYAGDGQTAVSGFAVPVRPAVKITDASGIPVSGVVVNFSIRSGNGSLTQPDAVSDVNGIATVGSWVLGSPGGNSLFAAVSGLTGSPVIFVANATLPPGSSVRIVTFGDSNTDFGFPGTSPAVVASYVSSSTLRLAPTAPNSPYQLAGKIEAKWRALSSKPIVAVNHGISATSTGAGRTPTVGAPDAREQVNGVTRFEGEVMGTAYPWSGGEPTNGWYPSGAISRVQSFTPGANDFVYVSMGTNDPGASYPASVTAANIDWMIGLWVNSGHSANHFILTTLAPNNGALVGDIPKINDAIRALATSRGVALVDLAGRTSNDNGQTWRSSADVISDGQGVHYSEAVRDWLADQVVSIMLALVPN
jgi:hypothetical protein